MEIVLIIGIVVFAAAAVALYLSNTALRTRAIKSETQLEELHRSEQSLRSDLMAAKSELVANSQKLTFEQSTREEQRQGYESQIRTLSEECAKSRVRLEAAEERNQLQLEEYTKRETQAREQFKNMASQILTEQSQQFKATNKESIDLLLKPFKDNITEFRQRVELIYSAENEQRGALRNELKNLMELNRRITAETTNLTNALKGNSKVQGDWGEMILETILDSSNLIKGVHYQTQYNIKDAEGNNLRPDVVLFMPEGKQIVIDSKVSLTAFVNYMDAEDVAERERHLAAHVISVRQHVTELGRKEYQKLLNSPDFVIMFVPNEPAFLAALQADTSIWGDAYDKRVIISSPTNLFALLKLVDDLWKRNAQSKNTANIVTYGTKLYDQLVNFTSSLEGVGQALSVAQDKYADAYKRLATGNDNIIRSGERLRKLGLPTKKRQSAKALDGNIVEDNETETTI
ncbi:MAG: DNA recombination protein RmuC [Rikenellaceae bacterium]